MIDKMNVTDEMLAAFLDGNATKEESAIVSELVAHNEEYAELNEVYESSLNWENSPYITRMAMVEDDWAEMPDSDIEFELEEDTADADVSENSASELQLTEDIVDSEFDVADDGPSDGWETVAWDGVHYGHEDDIAYDGDSSDLHHDFDGSAGIDF